MNKVSDFRKLFMYEQNMILECLNRELLRRENEQKVISGTVTETVKQR